MCEDCNRYNLAIKAMKVAECRYPENPGQKRQPNNQDELETYQTGRIQPGKLTCDQESPVYPYFIPESLGLVIKRKQGH